MAISITIQILVQRNFVFFLTLKLRPKWCRTRSKSRTRWSLWLLLW